MTKKLYIGNISYQTTKEDLIKLFSSCGKVIYIKFPKDKNSLNHRGYAFIEMSTIEEAQQAMSQLNKHIIHERAIVVSPAVNQTNINKNGKAANYLGKGECLYCSSQAQLFGYNRNIKGICPDCIDGLKKALLCFQN